MGFGVASCLVLYLEGEGAVKIKVSTGDKFVVGHFFHEIYALKVKNYPEVYLMFNSTPVRRVVPCDVQPSHSAPVV